MDARDVVVRRGLPAEVLRCLPPLRDRTVPNRYCTPVL